MVKTGKCWRKVSVGAMTALLVSLAHGEVSFSLTDSKLAAKVGESTIPLASAQVLVRLQQGDKPDLPAGAVIMSLVDNRLLAQQALKEYSLGELLEDNAVGFAPDVVIEDQLVSYLRAAYRPALEAALAKEKGGSLDGVIVRPFQMTEAQWDSVLGKPDRIQLDYRLTPEQQAIAARMELVRFRIGGKVRAMTFADIYHRQHVQGRNVLHNRDNEYLLGAVKQRIGSLYVLDWVVRSGKLTAGELAGVRQLVEDKLVKNGFLSLRGLAADIHDDNAVLKSLAKSVTVEEVRAYYDAHREDFRRIEKIHARHVRVATEAEAQAIRQRVLKKESFEALAREYSIADDKAIGGDLGWILHDERELAWLQQFAMIQKAGVVSAAVRMPQLGPDEPAWELVLVDERVDGYQAPDSESVRYVASQAIARRKAQENFRTLHDQLYRVTPISVPASLRADDKGKTPHRQGGQS